MVINKERWNDYKNEMVLIILKREWKWKRKNEIFVKMKNDINARTLEFGGLDVLWVMKCYSSIMNSNL